MKKILVLVLTLAMLCSCAGSDYVAKAGGEEISEAEFKFYLSSIKSQMSGTELSNDAAWMNQEIEGVKAIDLAKELALEMAAQNIAYVKIAENLGIELSMADEEDVAELKDGFIAQYGTELLYKSYLEMMEIDEEFIEMLCTSQVYSEKLMKVALEEDPVTDEEFEAAKSSYTNDKLCAKHILFSTVAEDGFTKLSEEEIAKKKALADETYQRVLKGEDFDALMFELSEDPGLENEPDGYIFGAGEMVAPFENCVRGLKDNEIGFAESDFGYHVIKRLPVSEDYTNAQIELAAQRTKLQQAMTKWKNQFGFTVVKNEGAIRKIN